MANNISRNPIIYKVSSAATNDNIYYLNNNLIINSSPAQITAVNNPIVWSISSSAITSSDSYAKLIINVNSASNNGEYFSFSGNSITDYPQFQLTAAAEPTILEYYSNSTSPSKSTTDIANCICSVLNDDFNFKDRFFAVSSGSSVLITAINEGDKYNFNFFSSSSDIVLISKTDSNNKNIGQNYKDYSVWADIYINSSGDYPILTSRTGSTFVDGIEINYNPNNTYEFNISNFVEPYLTTSLPSTGQTTFFIDNNAITNAYIVFGQKYDEFSNNFRKKFICGQSDLIWSHHSALDYLNTNNLSGYSFNFTTVSGDNKQFLTKIPLEKETTTSSLEYLSMILEGNTSLGVCLKGYYEWFDGTKINFEKNVTTTIEGGFYNVDVSYSNLNFGSSNTVRRYVVGVYRFDVDIPGSTRYLISPQITYNIQQDCLSDNYKQIVWLDNAWETFIFNGEEEITIDRDYEQFKVTLSYNPSKQDTINQLLSITSNKIYTAKSTWINKEHFEWLFSLTTSNDVRLYEDGLFKSIYITKFDYKLDTIEQLYSVEFDYVLSPTVNKTSNF